MSMITQHEARALLCDLGAGEYTDSVVEAHVTSNIDGAQMCKRRNACATSTSEK